MKLYLGDIDWILFPLFKLCLQYISNYKLMYIITIMLFGIIVIFAVHINKQSTFIVIKLILTDYNRSQQVLFESLLAINFYTGNSGCDAKCFIIKIDFSVFKLLFHYFVTRYRISSHLVPTYQLFMSCKI